LPRSRLDPIVVERIARGVASHEAPRDIAAALGEEEARVRRWIATPSKLLKERTAWYRVPQNRFEEDLKDVLDKAIDAFKDTLRQDKDLALRYKAAKDVLSVHGMTVPRDQKSAAPPQEVTIYQNPRVNVLMAEAVGALQQEQARLAESVGEIDWERHTKVVEPAPEET
jgi:hypothetical protein